MSRRNPDLGTVMMYGAPPPPDYDPPEGLPQLVPATPTGPTLDKLSDYFRLQTIPKTAHITAAYDAETKTLKLKVTIDGAVMGEVVLAGTNVNLTIPL